MTLALHNPTASRPLDWARLVPASAAAAKLGREPSHVTRLCRTRLFHEGLAFLATPPDGGQEQWFIHLDYDRRLLPGDAGAAWVEPDLAGFSARQQQQARARRACVDTFREWRSSRPSMKDWLPRLIEQLVQRHGIRVSRSALHEWEKKYQRPSDLAKLIDRRGGDNRGKSDPAAWDCFRDLYLHQNRPSVRQAWQLVGAKAKENGWTWCSLKSCRGQLDKRIPPEVQIFHREPARWRSTLKPSIAQDPEAWAAGECWIGDHKQLDVICRFNDSLIRPWLSAVMDWRSRKLCGYVLVDTPNSTSIRAALRHGLQDESNFGGPAHVWFDRGKDFEAWVFHGQTKKQRRQKLAVDVDEPETYGILHALGIEAHFAIPFNPNAKSRLERWFRTLEDFARTFDTYTGRDIDEKPEHLAKILRAGNRIPSFEQVRDRLPAHLRGYNACDDHSKRDLRDDETGERLSPDEAMARWCPTRRVMADPRALNDLMLHWHKPVRVGKNGIALTLRGAAVHYGQFSEELTPFKAPSNAARKSQVREVLVSYDPHDIRTVRVHDLKWRFICTAEMNGVGGLHDGSAISEDHVAQLIRRQAKYKQSLKHIAEVELTSCLTREEQLDEDAAAKPPPPRRPDPTNPPSIRIVRTPLDGQGAAIQRDQLRTDAAAAASAEPDLSVFEKLKLSQQIASPAARTARARRRDDDDQCPWDKLREAANG